MAGCGGSSDLSPANGIPDECDVAIETVTVGNAGNADDTEGDGYGGVNYVYSIGKYEVTAGQYRDFLNAVDPTGANWYGLYNGSMDSNSFGCQITWNAGSSTYDFSGGAGEQPGSTAADWENRPVNFANWGDAARLCNWLHNGQPTGTLTGDPAQDADLTEDGSYFLNGATSAADLLVVKRKGSATWVIASEDEWYKAAYHKNDGKTGNYWDYPTCSDSPPVSEPCLGGSNSANYYDGGYTIGPPYYRNEFGCYVSSNSCYGTSDQGGNLWEPNESVINSQRALRGGSFLIDDGDVINLRASKRHDLSYDDEYVNVGFRVAEVPDCNDNGMSDSCDLDCGPPDGPCDVPDCGLSDDCNGSGVPDECDIADGASLDCSGNAIPDECEINENSAAPGGPFFCDPLAPPIGMDECAPDCNDNGIADECDIEEVVYSNEFAFPLGPEWPNGTRDQTPGTIEHGSDWFLGQFATDTVPLTLQNLPPHDEVTLSFDVYVIRSWDGNDCVGGNPDIWGLDVQADSTLLSTTFSNHPENDCQSYPDNFPGGPYPRYTGAFEVDTLGYVHDPGQIIMDSVYRFHESNGSTEFTFAHSEDNLVVEFYAEQLSLSTDESWGLDNVTVTVARSTDCNDSGVPDECEPDTDGDTIIDGCDNCPGVPNGPGEAEIPGVGDQTDTDSDEVGDACDLDDDNDGIPDGSDECPRGDLGWTSDGTTDHDTDGCRDDGEDSDDDNDGVPDGSDTCPRGDLGWTSDGTTDHDTDGCRDDGEDLDDDNDGVPDGSDTCPRGDLGWTSDGTTDNDGDGCRDDGEDLDDDNDCVLDLTDVKPLNPVACEDVDVDGCDDCSQGTGDMEPSCDNYPNNDGPDNDFDGICNTGDNCVEEPNGPSLGTCIEGSGGTCNANEDCDSSLGSMDGVCSRNQEDADSDTWGDTCDNCPNHANGPAESGVSGVGNQTDTDGDGIGDACDVDVPEEASYPHDRRKNRYISFNPNPNNTGSKIAFKVELKAIALGSCDGAAGDPAQVDFCRTDRVPPTLDCNTCAGAPAENSCIDQPIDCVSGTCTPTGETCVNDAPNAGGSNVGTLWWAGPEQNSVHLLVSQPFRKESTNWPNPVHAGDCEVVPEAVYGVRVVNVVSNVESGELLVKTTLYAPSSASWWGDCVGPLAKFCGGDIRASNCGIDADCTAPETCDRAWTLPDGSVNFDDVNAALALVAPGPTSVAPEVTWVDLHGNASNTPGSQNFDPPNFVLNFSDVGQIISGFGGFPYKGYDPADCPPLGACCDGFTCTEELEASCVAGGRAHVGDGITCTPNPCP